MVMVNTVLNNRGAYNVWKQPSCWSWWVVMALGVIRIVSALQSTDRRENQVLMAVVFLAVHHIVFSYLCHRGWYATSWVLILVPIVMGMIATSFMMGFVTCKLDVHDGSTQKLLDSNPELMKAINTPKK